MYVVRESDDVAVAGINYRQVSAIDTTREFTLVKIIKKKKEK